MVVGPGSPLRAHATEVHLDGVEGPLFEGGQGGMRGSGITDPAVIGQSAPTEFRVLAPSGPVVEGSHRGLQYVGIDGQPIGQGGQVIGSAEP